MYKRDFITAEIQKLAQVLARIIGLRVTLPLEDVNTALMESLQQEFELYPDCLFSDDKQLFEDFLSKKAYGEQHLEMLSQFLYETFNQEVELIRKKQVAQRLDFIYEKLIHDYHTLHLGNLERQKQIQSFK